MDPYTSHLRASGYSFGAHRHSHTINDPFPMRNTWTKSKMIERLYARLPYSDQIKNLDVDTIKDGIEFDWRSVRFRIDALGGLSSVHEVDEAMIKGGNLSILLEYIMRHE